MSSKRCKNKAFPYCGQQGVSSTADHVLCRKFFAVEDRANLPIVPACESCNNAKSELELYACTVMPFAATHSVPRSFRFETKCRLHVLV